MDGRIIKDGLRFTRIDQEDFKAIDYLVMGAAFDIQNDMGRLFSESVYRDELKQRLRSKFDDVQCEVPLEITFEGFQKTYKADLVINGKAIFELKAVDNTVKKHRLQLQQYLFLTNLKHGKLINFLEQKVAGEYVSTALDHAERKRLTFVSGGLVESDSSALRFKNLLTRLLNAWGGFMNLELYYQATEQLLADSLPVVRPIPVYSDGRLVGTQKAHMLSERSAYKITALTKNTDSYRRELKRFLTHTELKYVHWVNLNNHEVVFETVARTGY